MTTSVRRRRRLGALCGVTIASVVTATVALIGIDAGVGSTAPTLTKMVDQSAESVAVPVGVRSPSLSDDGTFAAYIGTGTDGSPAAFVRDVKLQQSTPVPALTGVSGSATSISGDGCVVAFWGSTVGAGTALYTWNRCTPAPVPVALAVTSALQLIAGSAVVRPALSHDGTIVAYAARATPEGAWHVAVVDVASGTEAATDPGPGVVTTVDLSADGKTLAYDFGAGPPTAVFVGAPGSGGAPVPAPAGTTVAMPSLSADGTTVAFVDNATGSLRPYVYSATTGAAPALVAAASPGQVVQPALTPDGSQLAYTVATAVGGPSGVAIPAGTASTVEVARSTSGLFTSSERELLSAAPVPAGTTSATPAISATGQLTIFATSSGAGSDVWAGQRPAALTLSPSATFDLGTVAIGSSSPPARVTFANPSTVGIALGVVTPPAAPFAVVADTCSSVVVPAGGSCDVTVAFRPTDAVQSNATLTVGGEGVTAMANLSGTGRELARTISISPSTLQFPATQVGSRSGPVEATVSNTGEVPVTITSIGIDGSDAGEFVLTGNGCGGVVLDIDGTCTVAVTAIPSHSGSLRATISAAGSEGESASASLAATGTSAPTTTRPTPTTARPTTAPPLGRLQADPGSVTFEATPVGSTSAPAAVTVKNAGGSTVSSLKVQVLGGGEFAVAADDCSGKSLAVDRTCTLSVTVTPTVGGGEAATLTISGSRGESTSVALSATAAFAPTLRVNPGVVRAGDTTTVVGSGFSPSSAVRLELVAPNGSGTPIPMATTTSDESGGFRLLVTVPGSIGQGGWRLQIPAGSSSDAAQVAVLIESAPPAPGMPGGGGVIRPGEQNG